MLANPFTPGQLPRILAGRTAELRRIENALARVSTYGEIGGPLLVFHAPRGIGKTSLLREGQRRAQEIGFLAPWVSCSRSHPLLPEIAGSIRRAIDGSEALSSAASVRRWRSRLDLISVELGVPGAKIQAELSAREPADVPNAPMAAVEALLHETATLARRHGGTGLLLLIDELHAAPPAELSLLLNALQNLDGDRADNPLTVVTAGLPVTPEALTRAATFGERSMFIAIDLLAPSDARAALTRPAEESGVGWTDGALAAILQEARGYPYLLQLLGSTTWDAAGPAVGERLTLTDVKRGLPAARDQLAGMHRARWGAASPRERDFLAAMAAAGTDNVTRGAIAAAMGVDTRAVSVPRERLIDKGVIEPVGHGLVRFTLPGFGEFVRGLDLA